MTELERLVIQAAAASRPLATSSAPEPSESVLGDRSSTALSTKSVFCTELSARFEGPLSKGKADVEYNFAAMSGNGPEADVTQSPIPALCRAGCPAYLGCALRIYIYRPAGLIIVRPAHHMKFASFERQTFKG